MFKIYYLYQSGFYIETKKAIFLFNYISGSTPKFSKGKPIYIFINSCSSDHFNSDVFHLGANRENVHYIVAKDRFSQKWQMKFFFKYVLEKETRENIVWAEPNKNYLLNEVKIWTYNCTDTNNSLAYLVQCCDKIIFHAGYLNNWSWPNKTDYDNNIATKNFKKEVDKIGDININAAFLVLNPAQQNMYAEGFDYFMRNLNVDAVFPMNFKDESKIIDFILNDPVSEPYREKIKYTTQYTYKEK